MTANGQPAPPPSWQMLQLRELAQVVSGVTKGRRFNGVPTVYAPYLRVANVQDGHLDLSEIKEIEVLPSDVEKYRLLPGDVLMTEGGDRDKLGRGTIWRGEVPDCIHQNHIFRVRCDRTRLLPEYLSLYLSTPDAKGYFLRSAKQTTGIASINSTQLNEFPVAVPPLQEQRRITAILDRADAIRRKRAEGKRLTEELLRSTFLDMFGDPVQNPKRWELRNVGDMADVQGGLQLAPIRDGHPIKVPYLRVANVYRDRLDLREIKKIGCTVGELERVRLIAGDILLVEGHGNREEIGRAAIWDGSIDDCVHQNHLIRLRVDRQLVEPVYLNAFINSEGGRRQLVGLGKTTSGLNTISVSNVRQVKALLPSLLKQRVFAARIERIRNLLASRTSAHETAGSLCDSVVQRAFRGEL